MADSLRQHFPHAKIAMLIRRYTGELIDDNPHIDDILFYDNGSRPLPFFHLVGLLRSKQFDIVFHTYPRFRLALMTWFAGIPVRIGTGYRWYSFLFNRKVYEHRKHALRHELEYNLNLLSAVGCPAVAAAPSLPVKQEYLDKVKSLLRSRGIQEDDRFVILHPGSGRSARDWSAKNFGLLGQRLTQHGTLKLVITGGKGERRLVDEVQSLAGTGSVAIVDELNLKELAALAKLSALFVANSTGPLHIAAAVGTPVIGLYPQVTALNAVRWGPYTENKTIFAPENKPVDCDLCLRQKAAVCECMESISVDKVYEAAVKHLSNA